MAARDARHQSAGCCSAQPVRGESNAACASVAVAVTDPSSSTITARDPPVPTSSPSTAIGSIGYRARYGKRGTMMGTA